MSSKFTKEQEAKIINTYNDEYEIHEIAAIFNVERVDISEVLNRNAVFQRSFVRKIKTRDFPKIVEMYRANMTSPEIAAEYKVSHTIILRILEKQGCPRRNADDTHRIYPIREDYFDSIDTPEKAYILGFTYADGCNHLEGNWFDYDLNRKDVDLLYKISSKIYLEESDQRIKFHDREKIYKGQKKILPYAKLIICSKHMCETLDKLGCEPRKSLIAKFPEWLVDPELQRHFIRGYYDGDGGVYVSNVKGRGALSRIIGSKEFIFSMANIITKETNTNIQFEHIYGDLYRTMMSGNQQNKRFLDWLYQGSTIHLDRKYNLYQKLLQKMEENPRTRKY